MATKFIVDTHALIWHLEGRPALGSGARAVLDSPDSELVLPIIALAEAVFIIDKAERAFPLHPICLMTYTATRELRFFR